MNKSKVVLCCIAVFLPFSDQLSDHLYIKKLFCNRHFEHKNISSGTMQHKPDFEKIPKNIKPTKTTSYNFLFNIFQTVQRSEK